MAIKLIREGEVRKIIIKGQEVILDKETIITNENLEKEILAIENFLETRGIKVEKINKKPETKVDMKQNTHNSNQNNQNQKKK